MIKVVAKVMVMVVAKLVVKIVANVMVKIMVVWWRMIIIHTMVTTIYQKQPFNGGSYCRSLLEKYIPY